MEQTNKIANPINNLSYDKTSAISIFEYSKGLLGRSLREFIKENYSPKKGKGGIGQMVENLYFLLETNNNPEADFSSAGMELKCTPVKLGKNDTYLIKERLVCNMINYCEVVKEDFEQSHFYLKCQLMYNPQIQISAESGTKRSNFRQKDKTKRSKKGCTQHL